MKGDPEQRAVQLGEYIVAHQLEVRSVEEFIAAVENGYCPKNEDITVKLKGGDLRIRYTDDAVYLSGGCVKIYEGKTII